MGSSAPAASSWGVTSSDPNFMDLCTCPPSLMYSRIQSFFISIACMRSIVPSASGLAIVFRNSTAFSPASFSSSLYRPTNSSRSICNSCLLPTLMLTRICFFMSSPTHLLLLRKCTWTTSPSLFSPLNALPVSSVLLDWP